MERKMRYKSENEQEHGGSGVMCGQKKKKQSKKGITVYVILYGMFLYILIIPIFLTYKKHLHRFLQSKKEAFVCLLLQ